jgi:hypothetical protein
VIGIHFVVQEDVLDAQAAFELHALALEHVGGVQRGDRFAIVRPATGATVDR